MTELLARLTLLGDGLLGWLVPALLWTGALVVLARAVDELLSRRVSASWRIALYAVVLLRLALPAGWETPFGVLAGAEAPAPLDTTTRVSLGTALAMPLVPMVEATAPTLRVEWTAAVPLAWSLGTLAMFTWMIHSRRRLERELAGARAAREGVAALAPGTRVLEHPRVGPAVAGVLRPRIVIPSSLIDLLGRNQLAAVMRHESAHVERRDPLLQAGVQLTLALLWPVLPLWLAGHRVRQLVEQACDERALAGRDGDERVAYGEALLAVAAAGPAPVRPALGLLSFGAALRSRMKALRHGARWPAAVQLGLVAVSCLALVMAAGTRPSAEGGGAMALGPAGLTSPEGSLDFELSLNLRAMPLHQALGMFADLGNLELTLADDVPDRLVSLQSGETPWSAGVDLLCRTQGLHAVHEQGELRVSRAAPETIELMRVLYEGPMMLQEPGGRPLVALAGTRLLPPRSRLSLGALGRLGLGRSDGGLVVAEGPMSVTLTVETLLVPGVPEESATGTITGTHLLLEGPNGPWRVDGHAGESGPTAPALPRSIRQALSEVASAAANAASAPGSGDPGWIASRNPSFAEGVVRLEGRFGSKELYAAYLQAMIAHPRFDEAAVGITGISEKGLQFRLQARWIPDPNSVVGLIQLTEGLARDHGVSIRKIGLTRRTSEGAQPLNLGLSVESEEQARAFEEALRSSFPGTSIRVGPLQSVEGSGFSFSTRLVFPPGLESITAPASSPGQVLVEFRIAELSPGAELPSGWRGTVPPGRSFSRVLGRSFNTYELDAWVQGAEQRGDARIVSAPRMMVQVGEKAEIESGHRVPVEDGHGTEGEGEPMRASLRAFFEPEQTADGVVSEWRLEVAEPLTRMQGSVREGETVLAVGPVHPDGRRIAVWITPNLQRH